VYLPILFKWKSQHSHLSPAPSPIALLLPQPGKARWGQYAAAVATYADFIAFYHSVTGMDMADSE
jgi:hypothetical protein